MSAIIRLTVHKLHTRWRGWAALVVLTGLAGAVVLTAAAGALRTDSAYPRFLKQASAADVLVAPAGRGLGGYDAALARLPQAALTAPIIGLQVQPVDAGGTVDSSAETVVPLDGRMGHQVEVPKLLAGRLPGGENPGEVAVNLIAAQDMHVRVGATVRMAALSGQGQAHPRMLTERVVGVYVDRGSVVAVNELDRVPVIWASIALYRELGPGYEAFDGAYVTLRPGMSLASYTAGAQALARRFPGTGGQVFVADETLQAATIERAIRPQAVALALFALALALCALLIVGQVAARLLLGAARDNATLAALGMTRRQLLAAGMAEVGAAAAAGAAIAVIVAVAASPLMPIGPARLAEPDPGVSVNIPVLLAGFAAIVAALLARVGAIAWRQASARPAARGRAAAAAPFEAGRTSSPGLKRAAGRRHRRAVRARPRSRPVAGAGAQRRGGARRRAGRGGGRRHVRREPGAPCGHAAAVRPGLGRRDRPAVRHHDAPAVRRAQRPRAGHRRLDVRRARHG